MHIDFTGDLDRRPFQHGPLALRALDLGADIALLHRWFAPDHARFWGMQDKTEDEVRQIYAALVRSGHAMAYMGLAQGCPAFLVECYDPAHDELGRHYRVRPGDIGMHFFVGPPSVPQRGFTRNVFRTLMHFIFDRMNARRVVVEPDVRNERIHVLNREMGFIYHGCIRLPHKLAALGFCTRERFVLSRREEFAE